MIVCIIAEGSYPYITGGVSGWIHQLISGLPDVNFKVASIMPSRKENLQVKYSIPKNLLEVKTIYLDSYMNSEVKYLKGRLRLSPGDSENIRKLLRNDGTLNWAEILQIISRNKAIGSASEFLQSPFFWDSALELYREKYPQEKFNTFFWTLRTMLLPFLNFLQQRPLEADIYHAVSTGYAGILGAAFSELQNRPFLLTEHGIYAREREEEILKAKWVTGIYKNLWIDFFYFLAIIAYKEADKIMTLYKRNQDIQLELGAPMDRVQIVSNGVNPADFKIQKQSHEGYIIGAILRIVPIKDVMTLIRAFKTVRLNLENVKLMLIGPIDEDLDYYQQCLNLVKLLKLEDDVIFTGRVNVKDYLGKLDILVLTSISEGQPLVILEGMAAKLPIIATNVGSCRELLEADHNEGACGVVTNLVSPNETAAQIIALLENKELRFEMGRNGRRRIKRAYTEELFLRKYREIYQDLGEGYGRNRV